MNTSKLADIAEITSSIAILVTLIFLVVQMQQNTAAIQANGLQASLSQDLQHLYKVVDNPELVLDRFKPAVTDEDRVGQGYYLAAYFRMREHDWMQYQNGNLEEDAWETFRRPIAVVISSQRVRDWWRHASPAIFDPSFVAEVNALMTDIPVNKQAGQAVWAD